MYTFKVTYAVMFLVVQQCDLEELPSFIHVCRRDEPNLSKCLITATEDIRPFLAKGVPEYNIPSVEPLVMNELISEQSGGLSLTANHVKTYGCSNYSVTSIQVNLEDQTYELDIDLPLLRIEAQYNISGKLVMMPIRGDGPMQANVTNCKSKTLLKGELYQKDGDTYLRYKEMTVHVHVGGGHVKVDNLFHGDKIINDVVNESVNKNLDAFLAELMPVIERALASTFLKIANTIVEPYTYKQLFPH